MSTRIRLLVLLTILPAILLVIFQARHNREDAMAVAEDGARVTVQAMAASQQRLIDSTQQFLQKLANMPAAQQPGATECSRFLAEVLTLNSSYVNLGIPLADGSLLCNATPLKAPVNVADRPYIRQALSTREFSVGPFQLDRVTRIPTINFAYPVINPANQQVIGAAVAVLSLEWWSRRLADLSLPDGAVARVTDPSGHVIARFPPEPLELGMPFDDASSSTSLNEAGDTRMLSRRDRTGARQLVASKPLLKSAGGAAVATMSLTLPLEPIYAAANHRLWKDIGFLLAGMLASFVLAELSIRRAVASPLRRLVVATDQLAQGRYVSNLPTTGIDELVLLAESFNRMAAMRQGAEADLRRSEEDLSITLQSIGDAVMVTDAEGHITRMNAVAERLTGWSLPECLGRPLHEVFRIVNASTRQSVIDPVQLVMARGEVVGLANHTALLARDGAEYQIADSASPIRNAGGRIVGVVLVFSDVSDAYRVQRQLEENEARFRTLAALSSDWYWEQDAQFRFVRIDGSANDRFVASPDKHYGKTRWELGALNVTPEQWEQHKQLLRQHLDFRDFELERPDLHGQTYWASISGTPILAADGRFCGYRGVGKDITARKHAENELRVAAIAFESQEAVIVTDRNAVVLRTNQAFSKITGYSAEEAIGQSVSLLSSGRHDAAFFGTMHDSLETNGGWHGEIWNRCKNAEVRLYYMTITAVTDAAGSITHYVSTLVDITQKAAAAREIEHLAFYDALTHLPNRRLLVDRLQQALVSSTRSGKQGALLCLDLDQFKTLNDTLGHDMGDVLLQQVAHRLIGCVREGDTVARFGGDEFLVLLEDLSLYAKEAAEQTQHIGEKILAALNRPYQLASHHTLSTPSIGAVLFNGQSQTMEELIKYADLAMYAAKSAGRNTIRFFDPKMQATVSARAALESDLRTAVAEQQFELHYQVQVTHTGQAVAAEVLIRWQHPTRGMVSPGDFIPLAEETGLILPIGLWVLETACLQLRRWQDDPAKADLELAVNVSARQFRQPEFTDQVRALLQQTGARPDRLKLELTESLALDNVGDTIAKMNALRALGLRFSIDDFGTGHSSLSYLTRLPLDQLKIDQSFVRNIGIQQTDALIVQTIIGMADSLGLDVIAEGVETEPQRAFLEQHGCPLCQGYLFSRPVPLDMFERLLSQMALTSAAQP